MAAMDSNKRKFLKHLSLLGLGALIGLGITQATSPSETQIIKNYSDAEYDRGRKIVWNDVKESKTLVDPPKKYKVLEGGIPEIKAAVCGYHIDKDADGIYEKAEEGSYCSMPCKSICPVNALFIKQYSDPERSYEGKKAPEVDIDLCIGCTKCFQICGYNAIQWINNPE